MFSMDKLWLRIESGHEQPWRDVATFRIYRKDLGRKVLIGVRYETDEEPSGTTGLRIEQPAADGKGVMVATGDAVPVRAQGVIQMEIQTFAFGQMNVFVQHNGQDVFGNGIPLVERIDEK